jgi:hypothetical protein
MPAESAGDRRFSTNLLARDGKHLRPKACGKLVNKTGS